MAFRGRSSRTRAQIGLESRDRRYAPEERDLQDLDDHELYLAEKLRDWQLDIGATTLEQIETILGNLRDGVAANLKVVKNDLGREQYLAGQLNMIDTVAEQVNRAARARRNAIGAAPVEWTPPSPR